jgi:uncharacterized metal-binding protein
LLDRVNELNKIKDIQSEQIDQVLKEYQRNQKPWLNYLIGFAVGFISSTLSHLFVNRISKKHKQSRNSSNRIPVNKDKK